MAVTTLKASPLLIKKTLALIEKSFHYEKHNSFSIDFAPLVDESNHHNCFVLTDESGEVAAHIGVSERKLGGHTIALLGGIAVDESKRGQGLFQELITEVMSEKISDVAFFLLWSDKETLYKKFGFHLAGPQYETQKSSAVSAMLDKTTYAKLTANERKQLQTLYKEKFLKENYSLERTEADWNLVAKITSADLYVLRKDKEIVAYCFMNKGQDLKDVVYEYVGPSDHFRSLGNLWTGQPLEDESEGQYQFMLCPGDQRHFSSFIADYTHNQIRPRAVNAVKQEIYFDFGEDTLVLETEEFLRGVLGPGQFEELGNLPPIFISGLDSI